jgi:hypothetical protein
MNIRVALITLIERLLSLGISVVHAYNVIIVGISTNFSFLTIFILYNCIIKVVNEYKMKIIMKIFNDK